MSEAPMTASTAPAAGRQPRPAPLPIAWRFALRELRGGLAGFYVFIACIALGVMAIAGVNSVSRAITSSIAEEGQSILGGDIAFQLIQREATADEKAFIDTLGTVTTTSNLRVMARKPGSPDQTLVELKGIDAAYPLYGKLVTRSGAEPHALIGPRPDGSFGALIEDTLTARLGVKVGDTISVGTARLTIADVIVREPDRVGGGINFGPRVMVSQAAVDASGLIVPGSLMRFIYLARLADPSERQIRATRREAEAKFPLAGWEIRARTNAAPGLSRQIERFTQFLTLVGLTALIVGGVGVANAVGAFLDGKRDVIATLKCLGASGGLIVRVYLIQIGLIAAIGIGIGLALGAAIPFAAGAALGDVLPIRAHAAIYPAELALAAVYGLLTALAFALWPLGRAHDVQPTALFRDLVAGTRSWPRRRYLIALAATALTLIGLAVGLAFDRRLALVYVGATIAAFVLLRAVAAGIMALARRAPRVRSTEWRLAIANIHRPGALTPSVVLSLGLGLALLVALALVDGNLRRQLGAQLPEQAPSFFFLDVPGRQMAEFDAFLTREAAGASIEQVPMMRGRIVEVKGERADKVRIAADARFMLQGDRGITYSPTVPRNSRVAEGEWWAPDHAGPALVSFDIDVGKQLGLAIGDAIKVNVLGREFEAKVANFRKVQWESLGINFFMVFSPNTFRGAPITSLATVAWPGGGTAEQEVELLRKITASFPTVTAIRVKDALKAMNDLVGQIGLGIRAAASIALVASILVLAGALAAGQRHRVYEAVLLKTLGATRRRVLYAYGLEYAMLGLATAVFALAAGTAAAWGIVSGLMGFDFVMLASVALGATLAALVATLGFGLIGTWSILSRKSAPMLRAL